MLISKLLVVGERPLLLYAWCPNLIHKRWRWARGWGRQRAEFGLLQHMDRWGVSDDADCVTVQDTAADVVSPRLVINCNDACNAVHSTTSTPSPRLDQHRHEPPLSPSSAWRSASQSWFQGPPGLGHGAMRSRSNRTGRGSVVVPGYSSCVVALGFLRTMDGSLTEALRLRLDTAYKVWNELSQLAGEPQAVLVTGGDVQKLGETEADAM